MPFVDVVGKAGAVAFWQSGPMLLNVGVIEFVITISNVAGAAHCPSAGVNV
jgi:hypothetical protein